VRQNATAYIDTVGVRKAIITCSKINVSDHHSIDHTRLPISLPL